MVYCVIALVCAYVEWAVSWLFRRLLNQHQIPIFGLTEEYPGHKNTQSIPRGVSTAIPPLIERG